MILILLLGVLLFQACNGSSGKKTELIVVSDTTSVKYQCPMQCQGDTTYTTDGKCPVCEMDLEKLNEK